MVIFGRAKDASQAISRQWRRPEKSWFRRPLSLFLTPPPSSCAQVRAVNANIYGIRDPNLRFRIICANSVAGSVNRIDADILHNLTLRTSKLQDPSCSQSSPSPPFDTLY
jgi:hypothetical protein